MSLKLAKKVTADFHRLQNQAARLQGPGAKEEKERLAAEVEAMRPAYQAASVVSTERYKGTSRWVTAQLTALGAKPKKGEAKLKLLEVGAINRQLLSVPWLDVLAIDLLPARNDPLILKQDFFDLPARGEYSTVVCSMVINCVPDPRRRGLMLHLLARQLRSDGLLFLMLPLRCLTASPFINRQHLRLALTTVGFSILAEKDTPKVAFFCCRLDRDPGIGREALPASAAQRFPFPPPRLQEGKGLSVDFSISFAPYPSTAASSSSSSSSASSSSGAASEARKGSGKGIGDTSNTGPPRAKAKAKGSRSKSKSRSRKGLEKTKGGEDASG